MPALQPRDSKTGRTYTWQDDTYVSVTTVLSVLNKPALPRWAAKSVAEFVIQNYAVVSDLIGRGQLAAATDLMKGAPWRQKEKAADLGTAVHHAVEVMQGDLEAFQCEEEVLPFMLSFQGWYDAFKPEVLVSEGTIFNRQYNYAGTLDMIARIDGLTYLIDVKSGKGIYPEFAMQIAAYSRGDFIGHQDGSEQIMPIIDKGAVLHLRPDGYHFVPVNIGKEVFDSFLYCREMFRWEETIAEKAILPEVRK